MKKQLLYKLSGVLLTIVLAGFCLVSVSAPCEATVPTGENLGLFGCIGSTGSVSNLNLADVTVYASNTDAQNIGTVAGTVAGSVSKITATGEIQDSRTQLNNNAINVGALVGKAESGGSISGGTSLVFRDTLGNSVSGLSANVALFVADSDLVNHSLVGYWDSTNSSVSGKWIDHFYSSRRLSQSMQQRQDKVVDYMYLSGSTPWTTPVTLTHSCYIAGSYNATQSQTFKPGTVYTGMPYNHSSGSYVRFAYALDENNQVKQEIIDLGDSTWPTNDGATLGFTKYMGSDCSTAVGWAWIQVSPNQVANLGGNYQGGAYVSETQYMFPSAENQSKYGIYPVGQWTGQTYTPAKAAYTVDGCTSTEEVYTKNGGNTIYEAYAMSRKADALLDYGDGGHVLLLAQDPVVVRDAGNKIDSWASYVVTHEQGGGLSSGSRTSSWLTNKYYRFSSLCSSFSSGNYIPITIRALRDAEVAPATIYRYPDGIGTQVITSPTHGIFMSNYRIESTCVIIKDRSGQELRRQEVFTQLDGPEMSFRGTNQIVNLALVHKDIENDLPAGDYTFTVKATLGNGQVMTVVADQPYTYAP